MDVNAWNPLDPSAGQPVEALAVALAVNERGAANRGSSSSGVSVAKVQDSKQQEAVFSYKRLQMPSKV